MGQIPMEKFLDLYALKHTETKPEPAPTKSQHRSFLKWENFAGRTSTSENMRLNIPLIAVGRVRFYGDKKGTHLTNNCTKVCSDYI